MKTQSEFGKGLTYCLALFLCHSERELWKKEEDQWKVGLWFNAAGDHLFDLQIPKKLPAQLKKRLKEFRDKVLEWRMDLSDKLTHEDKTWAINEAKDLIREIDNFYGIPTEKGEWQ